MCFVMYARVMYFVHVLSLSYSGFIVSTCRMIGTHYSEKTSNSRRLSHKALVEECVILIVFVTFPAPKLRIPILPTVE